MSSAQRRRRKFATRNRVPITCAPCRVRKIKCNRELPCQNCIAYKDISSCKYERHDRATEPTKSCSRQPEKITQSDYSPNAYTISSEQNGTQYRGETHWSSVVQELSPDIGVLPDEAALTTAYNFGDASSTTAIALLRKELLCDLPPRKAIDELLKVFFDPSGPAGPSLFICHKPTFLKQYESFWRQPSRASVSWLGLLFSMLYLTTEAYLTYVDNEMATLETAVISQDIAAKFKARTVQCISHVATQQPTQTLQTMILLSVSGFITQAENSVSSIAAMVRAAVRMGLHRDPSNFPNVPVFEGEMRRRIWSMIRGMDALTSFHLGLPTAIRSKETDTKPPSSLQENDLYEEILELPPQRPLSEMIDNGYGIVKMRILDIISKIIENIHSLEDNSKKSRQMHELANKVYEIRASLPPHLQFHSWEAAMDGNPYICLQRVQLDILFHQAICVIYKRYIRNSTDCDVQSPWVYRAKCVQSAMALLSHQRNSYEEMQPGRYLQYQRWYGPQPFADSFFLPAIILCLYLQESCPQTRTSSSETSVPSTDNGNDLPTTSDVLQTLDRSRFIWKKATKSTPAIRIARILDIVIRHFSHTPSPSIEFNKTRPDSLPQSFPTQYDTYSPPFFAVPRSAEQLNINQALHMHQQSDDVNLPISDLDWDSLDSYVHNLTGSFGDSIRGIFPTVGFDEL